MTENTGQVHHHHCHDLHPTTTTTTYSINPPSLQQLEIFSLREYNIRSKSISRLRYHPILNTKIIVLLISDKSSFLHRAQNASFKLVEKCFTIKWCDDGRKIENEEFSSKFRPCIYLQDKHQIQQVVKSWILLWISVNWSHCYMNCIEWSNLGLSTSRLADRSIYQQSRKGFQKVPLGLAHLICFPG